MHRAGPGSQIFYFKSQSLVSPFLITFICLISDDQESNGKVREDKRELYAKQVGGLHIMKSPQSQQLRMGTHSTMEWLMRKTQVWESKLDLWARN